ncbi:hypothetical protein HZA98_04770 [Candidatus Woesearchaeota archaeon]|nr:hypothetical protein [Candidatus Woesearchaeota archaeon]
METTTIQTVELRPRKIEELNEQPVIETSMTTSLDGKWFIHKTIITTIKSINYMKKVIS